MTAALAMSAESGRQVASSSEKLQMPAANRIDRARTELLATFLDQMNAARVPYCLLNGFQAYPEVIASDVDFMVHPSDAERVAPLLQEVARRCGALLVQAIRHETGAWYFVLAKQLGVAVAYLHPDCTTDYRRDGRMWLRAEEVLAKRQRYKTFFVPAIADEFLYYLIKKILKQHISSEQWQRIAALYLSCPEECSERLRRFWSEETATALVAALGRQEIGWMRVHLPALLSELRASVPVGELAAARVATPAGVAAPAGSRGKSHWPEHCGVRRHGTATRRVGDGPGGEPAAGVSANHDLHGRIGGRRSVGRNAGLARESAIDAGDPEERAGRKRMAGAGRD